MERRRGAGLLLEAVVITASILAAFALDAAWEARGDRVAATQLLRSIRSDVLETRRIIADELAESEILAGRARALLTGLAEGVRGPARDSLLSSVGSIFLLAAWSPVNDTYTEALGSGRLALIEDAELRLALARYQRSIEAVDQVVDEAELQYYGQLEPFMVANTVYSEIAAQHWRDALVTAPFRTDYDALARSRELWNLVTLRLEMEVGFQAYYARADSLAQDVLARLPAD